QPSGICCCCCCSCATATPLPATAEPSTPRSTIAMRRAFVFRLIISNPVLPQFQPARPRIVCSLSAECGDSKAHGRLQCLFVQIQCPLCLNRYLLLATCATKHLRRMRIGPSLPASRFHQRGSYMLRASLLSFLMSVAVIAPASAEPSHGIAMNGEPELPADFNHFPYANPDAQKGGEIAYCVIGTFDNLNPFILRSMRTTARGIIDTIFGNLVFETLMRRNQAEPFSLYGHIAESIDIDDDRTFAEFKLNPDAKWSDGKPVTPEDVIFSFETFAAKGRPPYSARMSRLEKIEKTGDRSVRFTFNDDADREFPLIVALTPIIPAHAFNVETFDQTTLKPVVGSGPYVIE